MRENIGNLNCDMVYITIAAYEIGRLVELSTSGLQGRYHPTPASCLYEVAIAPQSVADELLSRYGADGMFDGECDPCKLRDAIEAVSKYLFKGTAGA